MGKILLIDDSEELGELVRTGLVAMEVLQATTVSQAETVLRESQFDLILIDVMLPDGNGFDLCTRLATDKRHHGTPKILLTAKDEVSEKVYGFHCGADDYVTKPFHTGELRARIERHLLRKQETGRSVFLHSVFEFQIEFQKAFVVEGEKRTDLNLTPTEFRLFLMLAKNDSHVVTREHLEKTLWENFGANIEKRGVDTHIAHLRKKLGALRGVIISVYGKGYSFRDIAKVQQAA